MSEPTARVRSAMDATIEASRSAASAQVIGACYALLLGVVGSDNPDHMGLGSCIFREVNEALRERHAAPELDYIKKVGWSYYGGAA